MSCKGLMILLLALWGGNEMGSCVCAFWDERSLDMNDWMIR